MHLLKAAVPAGLLLLAANTFAVDLITLNFTGDMSAVERQTFLDAAGFWNSAITGYKANFDSVGAPYTHSLVISATIENIDGVGGTLGSAGWTNATYADNDPTSPNPTLARFFSTTGEMRFDSSDTQSLVTANTFYGVVLHEMAHVLGIGTLWELNTTHESAKGNPIYNPAAASTSTNGIGEPVGEYTGQHALAAWQTEFGQTGATFVPIEKGGGDGTADGHWDEVNNGAFGIGPVSSLTGLDFSQELLTGWASDQFFLSTVTLGSLEDLGFDIDYTKAGVIDHTPVPEPAAYASLAAFAGVFALAKRSRRRHRNAPATGAGF